MNKEKVIKYHLLFFELISILTLLHGISHLIYYSIIMRFVTTNDFNSMIKASVNFTHNYTQNGLFDIKLNVLSVEFEELNEARIKEAISAKARKPFNYEFEPSNIEDYKPHQAFIILAKKNFNQSYFNLNIGNQEKEADKNFNLNSKDTKIGSGKNNDNNYNFNDKANPNEKNNYNLAEGNNKNKLIIDPNLKLVQEKGIESCFLFLNPNSAVEALNILFETNSLIHDNWNTIIFLVIILFFFFMKINIFFELIKTLNKFKFENFPNIFQLKNFYVYVIFNGTLFLIIPLLFFGYDDYNYEFCLGFSEAYFNSFLADRQIFLERQKEYFDPYQRESNNGQEDKNLKFKNNFFFVHDANRNSNNFLTRLGYLKNMLFLCVFVWLSGMRNIFNVKKLKTRNAVSEQDVEGEINSSDLETQADSEHESQVPKPSKRKKILRFIKNIILISIFSLYAAFGFLNFYDICKLTYLQISNNLKFLFRMQIFFKIFSFAIYFYLYSFTIIISIYHSYKMHNAKKMKIRDIKYKEIADDNESVVLTLEKENAFASIITIKEKTEIENNDLNEEKLNQDISNSWYFRRKSDDNLIVDKQANMQILKSDTNDSSENNDSFGFKMNVYEFKQESLNSEEINFKKPNKSIISSYPKKDSNCNGISRNSTKRKTDESENKNQNDEEYNKFCSQSSEEENK